MVEGSASPREEGLASVALVSVPTSAVCSGGELKSAKTNAGSMKDSKDSVPF